MIIFADTSAVGSAYLGDEADGRWISDVIFDGPDPVVISVLADVEFASLLVRAKSDGRIDEREMATCLAMYREHTADDGPIGVVPITPDSFSRAQQLVLQVSIRTLDALHLASAQLFADSNDDNVVILTLDHRQAVAAQALGLSLYDTPVR
ncbi:MAG TPA: type II toxin-antitoxin system VapC family toxin [Acidimicrobiales bacterium]|nr:type II toxin-antitoxin system VapC family toxin [Acidimicrobiales bacterium]